MDTYSLLRQVADSWVLLAMFALFVGIAVWAFLPGRRKAGEEAGGIPFRNERAGGDAPDAKTGERDDG